jgi:hypothetical protein
MAPEFRLRCIENCQERIADIASDIAAVRVFLLYGILAISPDK